MSNRFLTEEQVETIVHPIICKLKQGMVENKPALITPDALQFLCAHIVDLMTAIEEQSEMLEVMSDILATVGVSLPMGELRSSAEAKVEADIDEACSYLDEAPETVRLPRREPDSN